MKPSRDRLVVLVALGVLVEVSIAAVLRAPSAGRVASGDAEGVDHLAVVGLLWLPLLGYVVWELSRRGLQRPDAAGSAVRARLDAAAHRTRTLIAADSLRVALQPIVEVGTGRWVGVEALARFPDNGPPDRWFADAHEAGVGVELELHALREAFHALRDLPAGVYLSVNASPAVILDPGFAALMRTPQLPMERIVLEITEHTEVTRYDDIEAALIPHRARGLRLAVDDAGAGYASFHHVLRLRPDIIKLDRSLVTEIDTDSARRALVIAIVMLAMDTGAQVTAEGVETRAELDVLRCLSVDTVQGYLLARPSDDRAKLVDWQMRSWLVHAGVTQDLRQSISV